MRFFDFFRKKKEPSVVQERAPERQPEPGFHREREYVPSRIGGLPPEPIILEGNRNKNGRREGRWIVKNKDGQEGFIHYKDGIKHGLEKSPSGGYTLYYDGQVARSHLELMNEWKSTLRGYKVSIKAGGENKKEYSSKLEKLIAKGEEEWLEAFSKRFIGPRQN